MSLLNAAQSYVRAGLSVIPCHHQGQNGKRPKVPWKDYQSRIADAGELERWFSGEGTKALAVVCGRVSGGLVVLDFDQPGYYERWRDAVGALADRLPVQRTGGGGQQVFFRCGDPCGNEKLAWAPSVTEVSGRTIAIETRGEGGYVLVPPSLHPSGGTYEWINCNMIPDVPSLPMPQANLLLQAARTLDDAPYTAQELEQQDQRAKKAGEKKREHSDGGVIGRFNEAHTIEEMLERYGYTRARFGGRWIRPGGHSYSVIVDRGNNRSFHFSTNDLLRSEHLVDPFEVFLVYEHRGDLTGAVRAAAEELGIDYAARPPMASRPTGEKGGDGIGGKKTQVIQGQTGPLSFTDTGNALRLVELYGDLLRYNRKPLGRWYWWDGTRWREDMTNRVFVFIDEMVRDLYRQAYESDKDRRIFLREQAAKLESIHKQKAVLAKMETLQHFAIEVSDLDRDNWLFNCLNVTLDLHDGEGVARPPDQRDCITKRAEVEYDPAAVCPGWDTFLRDIFLGDEEIIEYVRRAVGYSLTGDVSEQCMFFAYGTGQNGKSLFFETLRMLFGDYYGKAPTEMLMQQQMPQHPTDVAELMGRRFVVASEIAQGRRLAEEKVKDLTGGDEITARRMRTDPFTFTPTHKLWMYGNHEPDVRDNTDSIWRRLIKIPFEYKVPEEKKRPMGQMLAEFRGELSGILNWALGGYRRYREDGLGMPERVRTAIEEYRAHMDIVGSFIHDCCSPAEGIDVQGSTLFKVWSWWCQKTGNHEGTIQRFYATLRDKGYKTVQGHANKTYVRGLVIEASVSEAVEQR